LGKNWQKKSMRSRNWEREQLTGRLTIAIVAPAGRNRLTMITLRYSMIRELQFSEKKCVVDLMQDTISFAQFSDRIRVDGFVYLKDNAQAIHDFFIRHCKNSAGKTNPQFKDAQEFLKSIAKPLEPDGCEQVSLLLDVFWIYSMAEWGDKFQSIFRDSRTEDQNEIFLHIINAVQYYVSAFLVKLPPQLHQNFRTNFQIKLLNAMRNDRPRQWKAFPKYLQKVVLSTLSNSFREVNRIRREVQLPELARECDAFLAEFGEKSLLPTNETPVEKLEANEALDAINEYLENATQNEIFIFELYKEGNTRSEIIKRLMKEYTIGHATANNWHNEAKANLKRHLGKKGIQVE